MKNTSWSPSNKLLNVVRRYQDAKIRNDFISKIFSKYCVFNYRFWSIVTGAEIPLTLKFGKNLVIHHPNGIVIHPDVVIGEGCMIFQQVTLGTNTNDNNVPVIGNNVEIGAGAKVLGGVKIGNNAKIGANAVVLKDIPSGKTAVGIPARIL